MAFAPLSLTALLYGDGFTLWHYVTPDAKAAVQADGYFNDAAASIRTDDWVLCRMADEQRIFPVTQAADGAVTIGDSGRLVPSATIG